MPLSLSRFSAITARGGIGCLLFLSCLAAARQGEPGLYMLQMKFKTGDTSKYQTQTKWAVGLPTMGSAAPARAGQPAPQGNTFELNAAQEIKVRRLLTPASAELEVVTTGQNSLPGQPSLLPADSKPILMTYDTQGRLLGIRRQNQTATENPMFGSLLGSGMLSMAGVMLPEKAVKIGETWTQQIPLPAQAGGGNSTVKTTFVRVENIGRYKTALLHIVTTTPLSAALDAGLQPASKPTSAASMMTGTATITNDVHFAINEGKVIKATSSGVANMVISLDPPSKPAKPAKKNKGDKVDSPVAKPPVVSQGSLKMSVQTAITTRLVEDTKK